MYQTRYSINITKNDIRRAKKAYKQDRYSMIYMDPIYFKVIECYLSHFSEEFVMRDILEESLMNSIIEQDSYLRCLKNPQVLIPKSYDKICDFICSIPPDFS